MFGLEMHVIKRLISIKMDNPIILTVGVYDLIKNHIIQQEVSKEVEGILLKELKKAQQVVRRELPEDVVNIRSSVRVKFHNDESEEVYNFTIPKKAKKKKKTTSILSPIGLAVAGRRVGDKIKWPFDDGEKIIEILRVERSS